ncbi:MAG: hypothetical protein M1833_002357 [Piccolia ochrophora]|nr:MAG: hypothetical protein M1833_002357 [Piccolia ochrophora]
MDIFSRPWRLSLVALVVAALCPWSGALDADVNVALKASFPKPPFLIELLESAAEENATSYFPILDRIAEGHFARPVTDEELYKQFLQLLEDDGHLSSPESLASFELAVSIHSAAPRIQAQYQFYETAGLSSLSPDRSEECLIWVHFEGKQYCSPTLDEPKGIVAQASLSVRQFDKVLGPDHAAPPSVLYADLNDPEFGHFHKVLSKTARLGKTTYRVRYKQGGAEAKPLFVQGYGTELALKRTDYIVIDDRDDAEAKSEENPQLTEGSSDEPASDLKPLSTSELAFLGLKASSYIMESSNPLDTLVSVSQDFPKHSAKIASHNVSDNFNKEFQANRAWLVPAGYNMLWMNGVQMDTRQIEPFALLEQLRRERRLVDGVSRHGFSAGEAVKILSHPIISESRAGDEQQRYDFRDDIEGGGVLIWLNDIEKDKRYEGWPTEVTALLQRTYPGQLPTVRRDIHNLVVPVDFTSPEDIDLVVLQLLNFVKRTVPLRFGIVPLTPTLFAEQQAKIAYHLLDTYGLSALILYFESSLFDKKAATPNKAIFESSMKDRKLRKDKEELGFEAVLDSKSLQERIERTQAYVSRLGANSKVPPILINGVALPRNDEWLQSMSARVNVDLRTIQRAVFEEKLQDSGWLPDFFISNAAPRRNALIVPEDEATLRIFDLGGAHLEYPEVFDKLPRWHAEEGSSKEDWLHLIVVADFNTEEGNKLMYASTQILMENPGLELALLHNPQGSEAISKDLFERLVDGSKYIGKHLLSVKDEDAVTSTDFWQSARALTAALGLGPGQQGLALGGRLCGPIPSSMEFGHEDFKQLFAYERAKRSKPVLAAIAALQLEDKIQNPVMAAKLSSAVAVSTVAEVSEGVFEAPSTLRTTAYEEWNTTYTGITIGDRETAVVQIVAAVDPASETAQRWIPVLKAISELNGVHLTLSLNPRERLDELPIKRFYRYVLESKPRFDKDGSVKEPSAQFSDVPKDALLTVGMDVPPSWLVAPQESIQDLDNIKLSSLKEPNVNAVYELEHILIEGHSRDTTAGPPPRGAQLVLGTALEPHAADTIIMANLGYFQFKANPGFWKLGLQEGRSQQIFTIDSAGTKGYASEPGDESTEIELLSFQGKTLFPRLSRKPGQETEDVLESVLPKPGSAKDYFSKGLKLAEDVLSNVGLARRKKQADINIFSVASGHLYERMLNIMMVSVMKHTEHTVKFWFIEQFLSPSFKDFIPDLAEEYGFEYEMVTYKWPHWLRAQKEKQREIWGYKILFLDVLFPLSLDNVIFVDADQIVRTDLYDLVTHDLHGAPYGFTPMCDSRTEMEGFRFWKQGYWKNFLQDLPYHISALYVVDLRRFRQMAAGDRLRQQYHQLSADPGSLSNLDQDLPNHMQHSLPIHSLPQEWLWCETWCSDEALKDARTIDLCNNPMTKEPKLDRARRQVPEWTEYDDEIERLRRSVQGGERGGDEGTLSSTETRTTTKTVTRKRDEL